MLAVISSQRGLLHHYLWQQEVGMQALFDLEEALQAQGEHVVWPTK